MFLTSTSICLLLNNMTLIIHNAPIFKAFENSKRESFGCH